MVTVVVLAILAAIAIPAYQNYILRGYISNGTNGLSSAAAQMEQYFQDNRTYASFTNGAGTTTNPPCATTVYVPNATAPSYFGISCVPVTGASPGSIGASAANSATAYVLIAQGFGNANGFLYSLDNQGNQKSIAGSVWSSLSCPTSWVMKPGVC